MTPIHELYIPLRGIDSARCRTDLGALSKLQDVSAIPQLCRSVLFNDWKYFTRFRSKVLMSCTAWLRNFENSFTNEQASSVNRPAALIKAILPERSLLVSSLATIVRNFGFPKYVKSKWFNPASRIPCILMTNTQSSSRSRERISSRDIPSDFESQSKNKLLKPLVSLDEGISTLTMPMMTLNLALLFVFQLAALQFFFGH